MPAKLKVVYFGSDFLSLSLQAMLARSDVSLQAVFASDQPGHARVRALAAQTRLVTERVRDDRHAEILRSADLLLSVGYNWKIPVTPGQMAVNLHPALLPACRGPTPIPWILFDKPEAAGVTLHVMTDVLDDGPIIGRRAIGDAGHLSFHAYCMVCNQLGASLTTAFLNDCATAMRAAAPQDAAAAYTIGAFPEERRLITDQMKGRQIITVIRRLGPDGALVQHNGQHFRATGGEFISAGLDRPHMKFEMNSVFASMRCADGFILFRSGELHRS